MNILHIHRKDIHVNAWNAAVTADSSHLPYAYSWYLDAVCAGRWSALVLEDYSAVMPLPWNRKLLGFRQIYRPPLCQQLGVFGAAVDKKMQEEFLKAIPGEYAYLRYPIKKGSGNFGEFPPGLSSFERQNLILDLSRDYENIKANYSKSLRKRLRKAIAEQKVQPSSDLDGLLKFYQQHLKEKAQLTKTHFRQLEALFQVMLSRGWADIYEVLDHQDYRLCMGLFFKTPGRIINVFGASNQQGREQYSMHILLDHLIQVSSGQDLLFDFEGSDIPGVAAFFKSFGAVTEPYLELSLNRLPPGLKQWKMR